MKILLTNDDGIDAAGLLSLAKWVQKLGDVMISAPKTEQSAKSHSINIQQPIEIIKTEPLPGVAGYRVDSTPADCVRFAIRGLKQKYDLAFSGINRGYNLGRDISYSGTVGAAAEATFGGVKSVALSTDVGSLDHALDALDGIYAFIAENRLFDGCELLNINIPPNPRGIRITRQGGCYYDDGFTQTGDGIYVQEGFAVIDTADSLDYDGAAVRAGYVSITPLTANKTDNPAFEALEKLNRSK